ncbi:hypothetical protein [Lacipirellula parvula]|uniref:hypothetical protein n=1 Tax=Lacipirellula parvula TaxID=2650471 RepID=UPI0015629B7F|nr:hypothetical protein [Lacipirellula parvula]
MLYVVDVAAAAALRLAASGLRVAAVRAKKNFELPYKSATERQVRFAAKEVDF